MEGNSSTVTKNCTERDQLGIPLPLLVASIVNWYIVVVLGTLVNMLAVWCVASCTKTKPAVKVLLLSVFLATLFVCLLTGPARAEILLAELACDSERITRTFYVTVMLVYSILSQVERMSIAVVAVLRTVAVWSPQRHKVKVRDTVAMVTAVILYCSLTGVGLLGPLLLKWVTKAWARRVVRVLYFLLNTTLPIFLTGTCYASMMLAVRRNKRRLQESQQQGRVGGAMNQATRALFALFVSNLVFGLPHGIFHLFKNTSHTTFLIIHLFFYPHFIVDPVVYIWFNKGHREQVRAGVKWLTQRCLSCSFPVSISSISVLQLHSSSTSSTIHPKSDLEQRPPEKPHKTTIEI